jgi:formate-dependent nitrite reductase membrane component NrfD
LFTVIYSAFLLGQAEGRDMWQSPLLPFQLFAQSVMVASGIFLVLGAFLPYPGFAFLVFPLSILVNLLFSLAGKFSSFASEVAMLASREMTHGRFRNHFWWGGIVLGHVLPLALVLLFSVFALPVAVLCVIGGLFFYEYAFVMAPQYIPNS